MRARQACSLASAQAPLRSPPEESKMDKTNSTHQRFERVDPKLSVGTALLHGPDDRGDAYIGGFLSRL